MNIIEAPINFIGQSFITLWVLRVILYYGFKWYMKKKKKVQKTLNSLKTKKEDKNNIQRQSLNKAEATKTELNTKEVKTE